jgi:hypothetical protein
VVYLWTREDHDGRVTLWLYEIEDLKWKVYNPDDDLFRVCWNCSNQFNDKASSVTEKETHILMNEIDSIPAGINPIVQKKSVYIYIRSFAPAIISILKSIKR